MSRQVLNVSTVRVECAEQSTMVFDVTGSPTEKENRTYDLTKFSDVVQMNRLLKKRYGVFTATERHCANAVELCVEAANAATWQEKNIDPLNSNFWAGGSGNIWQQPGGFAGIQGDDITRGSGTDTYLYIRGLSGQAGSPQVFGDQQMMTAPQQPWFEETPDMAGKMARAVRIFLKLEAVGTPPSPDPNFGIWANIRDPSSNKLIAGIDEVNSANVTAGEQIFKHEGPTGVIDIMEEISLVDLLQSPQDFGEQFANWDSGSLSLNLWWLADYSFPVDFNTTTIRVYEAGIEVLF